MLGGYHYTMSQCDSDRFSVASDQIVRAIIRLKKELGLFRSASVEHYLSSLQRPVEDVDGFVWPVIDVDIQSRDVLRAVGRVDFGACSDNYSARSLFSVEVFD